jgi:hypothetical protein
VAGGWGSGWLVPADLSSALKTTAQPCARTSHGLTQESVRCSQGHTRRPTPKGWSRAPCSSRATHDPSPPRRKGRAAKVRAQRCEPPETLHLHDAQSQPSHPLAARTTSRASMRGAHRDAHGRGPTRHGAGTCALAEAGASRRARHNDEHLRAIQRSREATRSAPRAARALATRLSTTRPQSAGS